MTTRYYEETPCEHGFIHPHTHTYNRLECEGGSRRELEGVEIWDTDDVWQQELFKRDEGKWLLAPLDSADHPQDHEDQDDGNKEPNP